MLHPNSMLNNIVPADYKNVLLTGKREGELRKGWPDPYSGIPLAKAAAVALSTRACCSSKAELDRAASHPSHIGCCAVSKALLAWHAHTIW